MEQIKVLIMENVYVLYGSDAVSTYEAEGLAGLKTMTLKGEEIEIHCYNDLTPITDVLSDAQGWMDNCIVKEIHYKRFIE